MNITEIVYELNNITQRQRELIILDLMLNEKISFAVINSAYVKYLEQQAKLHTTKESMMASCIALNIDNVSDDVSWVDSMSYVLIKKHLPEDWFTIHVLNRTDEHIKRVEGMLEK